MIRRPLIIATSLLLLGAVALLVRELGKPTPVPAPVVTADEQVPKKVRPLPRRGSVVPGLIEILSDLSLHRTRHIEAVRGLPKDLTDAELEGLIDLIRSQVPETRNPQDWYVILNEIMNVLHEPRCDIDAYRVAMAALVQDRAADPVVRDYAAQHLTLSIKGASSGQGLAGLPMVMETCLKIVASDEDSFEDLTGTVLLSLCSLNERLPSGALNDYRARLGEAVIPLVSGARKASAANRVSAIQASGRMGFTDALPAIRELARDQDENLAVRLSSVAALGYFSRPEDRDFLKQLAESNSTLSPAAKTALQSSL